VHDHHVRVRREVGHDRLRVLEAQAPRPGSRHGEQQRRPSAQPEAVERDSGRRDGVGPPDERSTPFSSVHLQVSHDSVALEVGDRDAVSAEGQRETEVDGDLPAAVPRVGADDEEASWQLGTGC
jgi:hypothetical protein